MKKLNLPIVILVLTLLPLPAMANFTDVSGILRVSAGYYGENNYLDDYIKTCQSQIVDEGFTLGEPIQIEESTVVMGLSIDFVAYFKYVGVGFSFGVFGFLNYVYLPYDTVASGKPYARIEINSYLFPVNVNVYFRYPIIDRLNLVLGGGPGYYLTYTTRKTRYMGVGDSVSQTVKDEYKAVNDMYFLEHDFGVQVTLGLSYMLSKSMSFDFGVNLHTIFATSPFKLVAVGYIGVTEKIEFNL